MSPAQAVLHPAGKRQKLQHPAEGLSTVLDPPLPGHVARAKSAPADPIRHLSIRDDDFLDSVEATPIPGHAVDSARGTGSSSAVPKNPLPSEANTSDSEGLDDLAAAILGEGMAREIRDTDDESYFIPSDEEVSDDEDSSNDEGVMSSEEEDLMVPDRGQVSGNSASNAIIILGSDDDSQPDAAENLNSDDHSQADPAEDLDMRMVARSNRNSFVLDTRTFCPMCRSPRHKQVPIDVKRPRVHCRHLTCQLFGYHVLLQDWHQNFTPAEKIIQLGHTILHCDGIRSQFVAEWNDCPHTPDDDFTDEEALALVTTIVQEQKISSALQNLLNVVATNASSSKNRSNGYRILDYDDEYMLD